MPAGGDGGLLDRDGVPAGQRSRIGSSNHHCPRPSLARHDFRLRCFSDRSIRDFEQPSAARVQNRNDGLHRSLAHRDSCVLSAFQPEPILVRAIRDEFRFDRFAGFEQAAVDGARRQRGSHKAKDSGSPSHGST